MSIPGVPHAMIAYVDACGLMILMRHAGYVRTLSLYQNTSRSYEYTASGPCAAGHDKARWYEVVALETSTNTAAGWGEGGTIGAASDPTHLIHRHVWRVRDKSHTSYHRHRTAHNTHTARRTAPSRPAGRPARFQLWNAAHAVQPPSDGPPRRLERGSIDAGRGIESREAREFPGTARRNTSIVCCTGRTVYRSTELA